MVHSHVGAGIWADKRGVNIFDGGAPYYDTYECADGRYVAVGAIERQFFAELLRALDVASVAPDQHDRERWPELRALLAERFRTKTRDEWAAVFAESSYSAKSPSVPWPRKVTGPRTALGEACTTNVSRLPAFEPSHAS